MVYPMPVPATGYQPYPGAGTGMPLPAPAMPLQSYPGAPAYATNAAAAYPVTRPVNPPTMAVAEPDHQIRTTVNTVTNAYPPDSYFADADKAAVAAFERTKQVVEAQHQQALAMFPQNDSKTRRLLEQAAAQQRVSSRVASMDPPQHQPRALSPMLAQQPAPWQPPTQTYSPIQQQPPVNNSYQLEPVGGITNFPQSRQYSAASSAPRSAKPHASITVRPKSVQPPTPRPQAPPQQPPQRLVTKVVTKVWPPDSWFNGLQELPEDEEEYHAPTGATPFYVPPKALPLAPGWQGETSAEDTLVATQTAHAPAPQIAHAPPAWASLAASEYVPVFPNAPATQMQEATIDGMNTVPYDGMATIGEDEAVRRHQQAEAEALDRVRQFEQLEFQAQAQERQTANTAAREAHEAEEAAYQEELNVREMQNQNIRREIEYRKKQQEEKRRFPHFECNGCGCGIMHDEVVYKPRLVSKALEHTPVLIPKGKRGPPPPLEPLPEPKPRKPSFHPPPREPSFHPPPREPSFHPPPREPSFHPPPREPSFTPVTVESFHAPPPRVPSLREPEPEPEPEKEEEFGIKTVENFDFEAARAGDEYGIKTVENFDFAAARGSFRTGADWNPQPEPTPPPPPQEEEPAPNVDASEYGIKTVENFDFDAARANQAANEYGIKTVENFDFDAAQQQAQAPPVTAPRKSLYSTAMMISSLERLKKKQLFVRGPSNQPRETIEAQVDDDNQMCVVCIEKPKSVVMFPCKHLSTCTNCAAMIDECPMCRAPIENRLEVFV